MTFYESDDPNPIVMMGGSPEDWGFIPSFLDINDPRSAAEQFNERYVGGWNPFPGFEFDIETGVLTYPDDPPMKVISAMLFRDEVILLFPFEWVMVLRQNGLWQVSRMD